MPNASEQQQSQVEGSGYQDAAAAIAAGSLGAAVAGTAPVVAGGVAGGLTAAAAAKTSQAVVSKILEWSRLRWNHMFDPSGPLAEEITKEYPAHSPEDLMKDLENREREFEREFRRRMRKRLERDIPEALAIPDPEKRAARLRQIFEREMRYTAMREEAIRARAQGALEVELLQTLSPKGAYWKLSPHVAEHTLDCLAMGEKFWPWSVLRKVHPPLHFGCPCELFGLDEAIEAGFMTADQVPDEADARRRYGKIADKIDELGSLDESLLHELYEAAYANLEEANKIERGEQRARKLLRWSKGFVKGGQFRPTRGGVSDRIRSAFDLPESPLHKRGAERGRWTWIGGKYIKVPEADNWTRKIGSEVYTSPAGGTNVYRSGTLVSEPGVPAPKVERMRLSVGTRSTTPELEAKIDAKRAEFRQSAHTGRGIPPIARGDDASAVLNLESEGFSLLDAQSQGDHIRLTYKHSSGTLVVDFHEKEGVSDVIWQESRPVGNRVALTRPAQTWDEHCSDSLAFADELGSKYGAEVKAPSFEADSTLSDHAGTHLWTGEVKVGKDAPTDIERAAITRAKGQPLSNDEMRGVYASYWVTGHELSHAVNPIDPFSFTGANANLEEALAEEVGHILAVRRLAAHGQYDVLDWRAHNPDALCVRGVYPNERFALNKVFDEAGIPIVDRPGILESLSFEIDPDARLRYLATLHAANKGGDVDASEARVTELLEHPNQAPRSFRGIVNPSAMRTLGAAQFGKWEDGELSDDGLILALPNGSFRTVERREPFPSEQDLVDWAEPRGFMEDGKFVGIVTYPPGVEPNPDSAYFPDGTPKLAFAGFRPSDTEARAKMMLRGWVGKASPGVWSPNLDELERATVAVQQSDGVALVGNAVPIVRFDDGTFGVGVPHGNSDESSLTQALTDRAAAEIALMRSDYASVYARGFKQEAPLAPMSPGVVTAPPQLERVKAVRKWAIRDRIAWRKKNPGGIRERDVTKKESEKLADLVSKGTLTVRVNSRGLSAMLKDGEMLTAVDRDQRPSWRIAKWKEESGSRLDTSGGDDYLATRLEIERTLFGAHPTYGYFRDSVASALEENVEHFGNVAVELKPQVKDRTSYTFGDSIDDMDDLIPAPVGAASVLASRLVIEDGDDNGDLSKFDSLTDLFDSSTWKSNTRLADYAEAQIFGDRPHLDEIARVVFQQPMDTDSKLRDSFGPNAAQAKALDKAGIPWIAVTDKGKVVAEGKTPYVAPDQSDWISTADTPLRTGPRAAIRRGSILSSDAIARSAPVGTVVSREYITAGENRKNSYRLVAPGVWYEQETGEVVRNLGYIVGNKVEKWPKTPEVKQHKPGDEVTRLTALELPAGSRITTRMRPVDYTGDQHMSVTFGRSEYEPDAWKTGKWRDIVWVKRADGDWEIESTVEREHLPRLFIAKDDSVRTNGDSFLGKPEMAGNKPSGFDQETRKFITARGVGSGANYKGAPETPADLRLGDGKKVYYTNQQGRNMNTVDFTYEIDTATVTSVPETVNPRTAAEAVKHAEAAQLPSPPQSPGWGWFGGDEDTPFFGKVKTTHKPPKPEPPKVIGGKKGVSIGDGPFPNYDGVRLTLGKGAGGSNGAKWASDNEGNKWLVKSYRGNADRIATELVANRVYALMGARVAAAGTIEMDGKPALTYMALDGKPRERVFHTQGPSAAMGEHYMTDALLANWDFAGMTDDNVLWDADGNPIRVDQGGTLEYRAQGQTKPFGPIPTDVWTMIRKGQGKRASKVTEPQMREQAGQIKATLTPDKIDALMDEAPFADEAMRERVRENLKARIEWMGAFHEGGVDLPQIAEGKSARDAFRSAQSEFEIYPEEQAALGHYAQGGSMDVQKQLRSKLPTEAAPSEVRRTIDALDNMLRDVKTSEDMYVYIPLSAKDAQEADALAGKTVEERGYLHATTQTDAAPDGMVRLLVPAGSHVLNVEALRGFTPPEGSPEVLVRRGSRMKVTEHHLVNGRDVLEATLLPPAYQPSNHLPSASKGTLAGVKASGQMKFPKPPESPGTAFPGMTPAELGQHSVEVWGVTHYATDAPTFRPNGSRWGHGGVYTRRPGEGFPDKTAKPYFVPGPLRLYSVNDNENGSARIWMGEGKDKSFNKFIHAVAKESGYPTTGAFGFRDERARILAERTASGENGPFPNSYYFIHYAHDLQAKLREKLEAEGFDGIEVGGEIVVWNYERLSHAKPVNEEDITPGIMGEFPEPPKSPGTNSSFEVGTEIPWLAIPDYRAPGATLIDKNGKTWVYGAADRWVPLEFAHNDDLYLMFEQKKLMKDNPNSRMKPPGDLGPYTVGEPVELFQEPEVPVDGVVEDADGHRWVRGQNSWNLIDPDSNKIVGFRTKLNPAYGPYTIINSDIPNVEVGDIVVDMKGIKYERLDSTTTPNGEQWLRYRPSGARPDPTHQMGQRYLQNDLLPSSGPYKPLAQHEAEKAEQKAATVAAMTKVKERLAEHGISVAEPDLDKAVIDIHAESLAGVADFLDAHPDIAEKVTPYLSRIMFPSSKEFGTAPWIAGPKDTSLRDKWRRQLKSAKGAIAWVAWDTNWNAIDPALGINDAQGISQQLGVASEDRVVKVTMPDGTASTFLESELRSQARRRTEMLFNDLRRRSRKHRAPSAPGTVPFTVTDGVTPPYHLTAIHELGHVLAASRVRGDGNTSSWMWALEPNRSLKLGRRKFFVGEWKVYEDYGIKPDEIRAVSRYACYDPNEAFAELFTAYHIDALEPETRKKFEAMLTDVMNSEARALPNPTPIETGIPVEKPKKARKPKRKPLNEETVRPEDRHLIVPKDQWAAQGIKDQQVDGWGRLLTLWDRKAVGDYGTFVSTPYRWWIGRTYDPWSSETEDGEAMDTLANAKKELDRLAAMPPTTLAPTSQV